MTRILSFCLVALLASQVPLQAQAKKDEPRFYTNSIGMKFVWLRSGSFLMGSPKSEKGRNVLEVQHAVELSKGFFMGVHVVTQGQWQAVMYDREYVKPTEGFDIGNPSRFHGDRNLPVESVTWEDCQLFIKKLRKRDRQLYRLPTEAEWEYACRANTTTPFNCGEKLTAAQANFATGDNLGKKGTNRPRTRPVGSFPPNAWGLYDMHGNVAQWCQDRFGPYSQNDRVDPQGPATGGSHILRGGSWEDGPERCRSASRGWDSNRGRGTTGLRVCFSLE